MSLRLLMILTATSGAALGQLTPEWVERLDVQFKESATSMAVDGAGSVYVVGTTQPSNQLSTQDTLLAKYSSGGSLEWMHQYNGPADSQDIGGVVVMAHDGDVLHVARSQGFGTSSDIAVIKHDAMTGEILWEKRWDGGSSIDYPAWAVVDEAGFIYIAGSTYADEQNDYVTIKMDSTGELEWVQIYQGPGQFLFAQDQLRRVALDGAGDVVVTGTSNDPGGHPDFVTIKYDGETGQQIWLARYTGAGANESVRDMVLDEADDVYVYGYSYQFGDKFATLKYDGETGEVIWEAIDDPGLHDSPSRFKLAGDGFLYQVGTSDPDGDESNNNDNMVVIKRDPASGAKIWQTIYGDSTPFHFDSGNNVVVDSDLNVIVLGRTDSFGVSGTFALMIFDQATGQLNDHGVFDGGENEWASGYLLELDANENIIAAGDYRNFNTEARDFLTTRFDSLVESECPADFNGDGSLDILDFVAFQNAFTSGDQDADCNDDGDLNILDFVCFQGVFSAGCA